MRTLMLFRSMVLIYLAAFLSSFLGLATAELIVSTPRAYQAVWQFVVQPLCVLALLLAFALRTLRYPYRAWRNSKIVCTALMVPWLAVGVRIWLSTLQRHPKQFSLQHSLMGQASWSMSWPTLSIHEGATLLSVISGTGFVILAMYYGTRLGLRWRDRRDGDLDEIRRHEAMLNQGVLSR